MFKNSLNCVSCCNKFLVYMQQKPDQNETRFMLILWLHLWTLILLAFKIFLIIQSVNCLDLNFNNNYHKWIFSFDQQTKETMTSPFSVPDRLTGYAALQELNPNRRWNFIEVGPFSLLFELIYLKFSLVRLIYLQ